MGIGRPPDPYGMTDSPAWPDADEDALDDCAKAFDTAAKSVEAQWEAAKSERSLMFEGAGLWSGGAAGAASAKLNQRIADLEALKGKLEASAQLFRNSRDAIIRAKNEIIDNVSEANQKIDDIQRDTKTTADSKLTDIRSIVDATRSDNVDAIDNERFKLTGESRPQGTQAVDGEPQIQLVSNNEPLAPPPERKNDNK